ncbi:hypothetical protein EAH89_25505 [Roseomonas nepalensis]|uniref:Uncharacterized protein n=1 Tax=Muricoccus nepalensis TaxID=1854500 RepID=A0A502F9A2_9PROT|nr:hypothetical protein [Roseomonas nepalensis]TPG45982.1 hypothetical protein EAH89_25505 [Roseomonas nepalensis]
MVELKFPDVTAPDAVCLQRASYSEVLAQAFADEARIAELNRRSCYAEDEGDPEQVNKAASQRDCMELDARRAHASQVAHAKLAAAYRNLVAAREGGDADLIRTAEERVKEAQQAVDLSNGAT